MENHQSISDFVIRCRGCEEDPVKIGVLVRALRLELLEERWQDSFDAIMALLRKNRLRELDGKESIVRASEILDSIARTASEEVLGSTRYINMCFSFAKVARTLMVECRSLIALPDDFIDAFEEYDTESGYGSDSHNDSDSDDDPELKLRDEVATDPLDTKVMLELITDDMSVDEENLLRDYLSDQKRRALERQKSVKEGSVAGEGGTVVKGDPVAEIYAAKEGDAVVVVGDAMVEDDTVMEGDAPAKGGDTTGDGSTREVGAMGKATAVEASGTVQERVVANEDRAAGRGELVIDTTPRGAAANGHSIECEATGCEAEGIDNTSTSTSDHLPIRTADTKRKAGEAESQRARPKRQNLTASVRRQQANQKFAQRNESVHLQKKPEPKRDVRTMFVGEGQDAVPTPASKPEWNLSLRR
ncbi:hypothetical protein B0A48_06739 [Cryoendolithus antarcticus]|uniref:Uncharacterized protein n=1 Tax=Cryoendolithus antarcticus TaxID=1507870 RepID=A0A1V8T958_9PEZI|nr:hypothetical protein B0A48_06739 [Cryoendolithus antarcticus]